MTTLDDTHHCPMCEESIRPEYFVKHPDGSYTSAEPQPISDSREIDDANNTLSLLLDELADKKKLQLVLERRVKVLTEALTRIRDEDIGPAKCVSIAYKALAPLPNEGDSPETAIE